MMRSLVVATVVAACGGGAEPAATRAGSGSATVTASTGVIPDASRVAVPLPDASLVAAPAILVPMPAFDAPAPLDRITSLSERRGKACVTRASGNVDCWGTFKDAPDLKLQRLPDITDAIAVRVGRHDRCVLTRRGVLCDSSLPDRGFELVRGLSDVVALADGEPWCALLAKGRVACWGAELEAKLVPAMSDTVQVASQFGYACAVSTRGRVTCGNAGIGYRPLDGLGRVRAIVLGETESYDENYTVQVCAIHEAPNVVCSEIVGNSRTGRIAIKKSSVVAPDLKAVTKASAVVSSIDMLVALVGGRVITIAHQPSSYRVAADMRPREVPKITDAVAITENCALRAQGSVVCWDDPGLALLPTPAPVTTPTVVVGIADVVSIARIDDEYWAVNRAGGLYRWGGSRTGWATPVAGVEDAIAVAGERGLPCVVRRDGRVACITKDGGVKDRGLARVRMLRAQGDTMTALLTDGTAVRWSEGGPLVPIPGVVDAVEVAGDAMRTCFRDRAGALHCSQQACVIAPHRGRTPMAMTTTCSDRPFTTVNLSDAVELTESCIRTRGGEVHCWRQGGPGHNGLHRDDVLQAIGGIDDAIGLGQDCAVRSDGRLTCWTLDGSFDTGVFDIRLKVTDALPAGSLIAPVTTQYARSPAAVSGCFIRADRLAACWGSNYAGEVGDGGFVRLDTPAAVPGL